MKRIRVRFRHLLFTAIAAAVLASLVPQLHAQVTATSSQENNPSYRQKFDLFVGGQYMHFNPGRGSQIRAINMEGWNATGTYWFHPRVGIEESFRNVYGTIIPPTNGWGVKDYTAAQYLFLTGVAIRLGTGARYDYGIHFDIGGAYGDFDKNYPSAIKPVDIGLLNTQLDFASAFGAFYNYKVTPRWSVRLYTDYQPTFYGQTHQNEFAGALGVAYTFGK